MKLIRRFDRALSRFLYNHPNFGISRLMLLLIVGNAAVYLLSMMDQTGQLAALLCLSPTAVLHGQIWRLVTFVFVPGVSNVLSLVLELYFYYLIGSMLEQAWGRGKFTAYYLIGMLMTVLYAFLSLLLTRNDLLLTGSYLSLSMFFVYATLWPDNRVLLFFFIPIKIRWLAIAEAVIFLFNMIVGRTLLPLIALLNYFLFCGDRLWAGIQSVLGRHPLRKARFRRSIHRAERASGQTGTRPYTRKCAVCGRTDTAFPNLEFRYCSRCVGYRCFCQDHIYSHVHFTSPD